MCTTHAVTAPNNSSLFHLKVLARRPHWLIAYMAFLSVLRSHWTVVLRLWVNSGCHCVGITKINMCFVVLFISAEDICVSVDRWMRTCRQIIELAIDLLRDWLGISSCMEAQHPIICANVGWLEHGRIYICHILNRLSKKISGLLNAPRL